MDCLRNRFVGPVIYKVTSTGQASVLVENLLFSVGYDQATTNVAVNESAYSLNARIREIGAAMGNPNLLQAKDYSIQKFK